MLPCAFHFFDAWVCLVFYALALLMLRSNPISPPQLSRLVCRFFLVPLSVRFVRTPIPPSLGYLPSDPLYISTRCIRTRQVRWTTLRKGTVRSTALDRLRATTSLNEFIIPAGRIVEWKEQRKSEVAGSPLFSKILLPILESPTVIVLVFHVLTSPLLRETLLGLRRACHVLVSMEL
jgi:hypothetical protein